MIPLSPEIEAMRPDSIPIAVMAFVWHGAFYQVLEFLN